MFFLSLCGISTDTLASFHRPKHACVNLGRLGMLNCSETYVSGWCGCPAMTSQPVRGGFRVETRCNSNSQWLICLVYSRESWGWLRQLREFFWSRVNVSYPCKWHCRLQTGSLVQRWQSWLETKAKNWLSANWVAKASVAFFPHRTLIKMLPYKGGRTRAFSALNKVSPNEYIWG